ncbi:Modular polyketide synthase [Alloactinosynnema sp. L-07]|uniref:acyl carrier protein n=1 Tax=Alloactinosynnema sp. L-07 TaxID=1653480 RepID=UPI00065F0716|nr:acyl carrier protein [Alloactinosynnema sp. L-07]CRK58235.1 Modular polyketide synthase [Alloactinosynnema sp. L-07]
MTPDLTIAELVDLPVVERREALEAALEPEFRHALLMTEDDDLPHDQSFFDLGLTSLGLTDLKQRLERLLGCEIDANVLFNSPTLESLLTYLVDLVDQN